MAGTTWRCARAFEQDPSGLVDPRRPSPINPAITGRKLHPGTGQPFAGEMKSGLSARAVAVVHVPSLTLGRLCHEKRGLTRGSVVASPRADLAYWRVDSTTRRRNPSSTGNSSPVRQTEGSPGRSRGNPRSGRTRGAADRAVERFLGPTVEKITRVVLASRTGLSSDTPWLEILDALEQLQGRHEFDSGLVATLRWLAQSPSRSSPRSTTAHPPSKSESGSTK